MQGYIHQLESFGSVDGPGVRFIIFFSGCPLRCKYCHNPDTWDMAKGKLYTADELLNEALSCKAYWGAKGGITVSGGEPLMQLDFLLELFTKAKEKGVNTCIDTAGGPFTKEGDWFEMFRYLDEIKKPIWIRHVLVPGITDNDEYLLRTRDFIRTLSNVQRVEILPYHGLGAMKYKDLGIDYVLKDTESPSAERVSNARKILECEKYDGWKK